MRTQLYLTPKDRGRKLSLEEFETADAQEGFHYDLIRGRSEGTEEKDEVRNRDHYTSLLGKRDAGGRATCARAGGPNLLAARVGVWQTAPNPLECFRPARRRLP